MTTSRTPRPSATASIPRRAGGYEAGKRAVDIAASSSLLVISSPVLAVVAFLIKREDGGPVLYRGVRAGRHGTSFSMLKFRTMVMDADRMGGPSTANDDARLTRLGRFLRHWKIDELPQLFNVLKGEMSLVGPRPQVLTEVETYTAREREMLLVRPGITDWASIRFRDEGAILADFEDPDMAYRQLIRHGKSWLGVRYVEKASFKTDFAILVGTLQAIFGRSPALPEIPPDAAQQLGLEPRPVQPTDGLIRKA